ncbi:armadillo repeat-containing protein 6 [Gossypium australe]|uniref:Armadillo repeat-containing protein 6 n=1 Tax=Gossypium australe TaxID=47621 RepID=A0A5B6VG12_9ROSI|nr:armadillo repeat-containing protein 6 [Gossypium australe]
METDDTGRKMEEELGGNKRLSETPPDDDCCPICFGPFTVPCRSNCGHWYCGSCILQFWNYSSASKPCGCPMCTCMIVNLMPEASLEQQPQNQEVTEVLKSVRRYNILFLGGARGFIQNKVVLFCCEHFLPSFLSRKCMLLSIIYRATPLDFIPTGGIGIGRVFDCSAIILILILRLVGIYRRRRLMQRVRRLAAMELLQE